MKTFIYSTIGAVGAGTITYLLMKPKSNRQLRDEHSLPIREAGVPEDDNPENAKMVAEGSQFGVNYYNHVKRD